MRCRLLMFGFSMLLVFSQSGLARSAIETRPFTLERTMVMPEVPWGPYSDYLAIDLAGRRLFATPQADHAVAVFDVKNWTLTHMIHGIGNPHGVFYSDATRHLFVDDGQAGEVKVYGSPEFKLVKAISVAVGANGSIFDPTTNLLYVQNGGDDAKMDHSLLSIIDTTTARKVGDISIDGLSLEAMAIDPHTGLLYMNIADRNLVAVVDLKTRTVVARWAITRSHHNIAMALDADHRRLYVGCRDSDMHGSISVLDLRTGTEIATLPIGGWVDSMYYDAKRRRIYASTGVGHLETYQVLSDGKFRQLESVDTAVMAKTSIYSPELDRMFVSVPHLGSTQAQILVFKPTP